MRDTLARFHAAITGAAPLDSARELVAGGELDGLHVYEFAYLSRIAGVLIHDYPKLAALVGEDKLRAWTAPYLRAHPPSNFSLREVGASLAAWLRMSESQSEPVTLFSDLATIERARHEVFDGPDADPLTSDEVGALDPAEFPSLRLHLVPSSRVVTITTNADDVWDAIESAHDIRLEPLVATRTILVWRRDLTVIHRTLEADEALVAHALATGTTFGATCELLGVTDDEAGATRAIQLLVRWLDAGILRR